MPGLVLRVLVEPGQRVEAGAGLVVLEAMKMENQIKAPAAGVVEAVRVEAGTGGRKGADPGGFGRPARPPQPGTGWLDRSRYSRLSYGSVSIYLFSVNWQE